MKTYRILSIAFIAICAGLLVWLFAFTELPTVRKVVFAICAGAVIALMSYNLVLIKRKQKEQ